MVAPKLPPEQRAQRSEAIVAALRQLGRPGDWVVRRGEHASDNAVALLTNSPFSHAAVLDSERDQIIETDGKDGVHITPVPEYAKTSQRLWLLRPFWHTPENGQEAVLKARELVGRKYDYAGLTGLDVKGRYYCSELCMDVYRSVIPKGTLIPPVISPGIMHDWATVLWDSGPVPPQ